MFLSRILCVITMSIIFNILRIGDITFQILLHQIFTCYNASLIKLERSHKEMMMKLNMFGLMNVVPWVQDQG